MSELKVETIKPAFGNKVTVSPGFLVTDSLEVSKFEITTQGTVAIMGPLYVGTSVSKSAGTAGQSLISQGAGSPPTWGGGFPVGGIIMWSGTAALVPEGWAICNGRNGTPDLTDKFVVGAGSSYSVGNSGGNKDAVVVAHTHTTSTVSLRGSFDMGAGDTVEPATGVFSAAIRAGTRPGLDYNSGRQQTTTLNADHTHSINSEGVAGTNANLPPYYALYYIMKIS